MNGTISRKASNNQHDSGPVHNALLKKVMNHGGWNSHREESNAQHNTGPYEDAIEEKVMIIGKWNMKRHANSILALWMEL